MKPAARVAWPSAGPSASAEDFRLSKMDTITAQACGFANLIALGVPGTGATRNKFLALCAEELEGRRRECEDLQVSVVAGA